MPPLGPFISTALSHTHTKAQYPLVAHLFPLVIPEAQVSEAVQMVELKDALAVAALEVVAVAVAAAVEVVVAAVEEVAEVAAVEVAEVAIPVVKMQHKPLSCPHQSPHAQLCSTHRTVQVK